MLPIIDDHAHLSPAGRKYEAVRTFGDAGGTHLIVSHMPYGLKPILSRDDWLEEFRITCDLAEEAERETGVRVFCVVGPYPVELLGFMERMDADRAVLLMRQGIDAAAILIGEQRAIGFGEVGRPHFPTDPVALERSNEILLYCMERAKDLDCAVVIHSEPADGTNLMEFSDMAKSAGIGPERVVKHYCGRLDPTWPSGGLSLSVLSTKDNLKSAIEQDLDFMMETDYLDDMTRPGAVMALTTVPKRMEQLSDAGVIDEQLWRKIHVSIPKAAYGIDTDE